MSLLDKLLAPWRAVKVAIVERKPWRIGRINGMAKARASQKREAPSRPVQAPTLMPGVVPASHDDGFMALDSAPMAALYAYANTTFCGMGFPGYPFLAELTQRSEYRAPSETIAEEMTRKWIKLKSTGEGNDDKITAITAEFERHKLREKFHLLKLHDGFYGRGQIYVQVKGQIDDMGRALPLIVAPETVKKGALLGFVNIEPLWTTPFSYNSNDPTSPDFFKPTSWYVLGKRTHASRLLTLVSRPVPDMLKPAYNFGGMSLTQLMQDSVESWLKTRANINRLINNFSMTAVKTDLSSIMGDQGGDALFDRLDFMNQTRDNQGILALQNGEAGEGEELVQVNTPLSGLHELQAQAQEHMAAPAHIPLVKLTGITPSGLNASADGEIDVFGDHIHASQERDFGDLLNTCLKLVQLDLYGVIDDSITYEFEPLKEMNGTELAAIRKSDADAAVALTGAGIISTEEERQRLASDPNSGYNSLAPDDLPPEVSSEESELEE